MDYKELYKYLTGYKFDNYYKILPKFAQKQAFLVLSFRKIVILRINKCIQLVPFPPPNLVTQQIFLTYSKLCSNNILNFDRRITPN